MPDAFVLERLNQSITSGVEPDASLKQQRVYILPSRQGIFFSCLLLTMLLGAINYNNNMAFMLTFLLASLFLVAMIHTYRHLRGLVIRGVIPEPVFAGDPARFRLILDNHGAQQRLGIQIQVRGTGAEGLPAPVITDVPADHWTEAELAILPTRRGRLILPGVTLFTSYPLGLFRAWASFDPGLHCIVYPRPMGALPLPPGQAGGAQCDAGVDNGNHDFSGFRRYYPGDSIRNIAWKAVAREQPLLIKRFIGSGDQELLLSWDDPGLQALSLEEKLSQLCRWLLVADRSGSRYSLVLPAEYSSASGHGPVHREACLKALALFGIVHDRK
ncbi:MAG: DUF58 domain-containing protein [Gammaproteobacteria bacterium]